jgi:glycosyltransferase involved in cell wall biosynthesis
MLNYPLISALMITGKDEFHMPMAKISINSFNAQTYPNKELVIINDGQYSLNPTQSNIREYKIDKMNERKLGDLRNITLDKCLGDFIIQWDDDDYSHKNRMLEQYICLTENKVKAVILKKQIKYSFKSNVAFVHDLWPLVGTILHERTMFRYENIDKAEDAVFYNNFRGSSIIYNNLPSLYIRFYHGHNTWDENHVMQKHSKETDMIYLNEQDRNYLLSILNLYEFIRHQ